MDHNVVHVMQAVKHAQPVQIIVNHVQVLILKTTNVFLIVVMDSIPMTKAQHASLVMVLAQLVLEL